MKYPSIRSTVPIAFILGLSSLVSIAEVRMPKLFSSHMVLQRDRPLPVWGWADPGEKVQVTLGQKHASATADRNGKWRALLDSQPMSKNALELVITGKNRVVIEDVLLGDVWLCSGQSNMDWALGACDVSQEIAQADHPMIRHFRVAYNFSQMPVDDVTGEWAVCNSSSASGFSAVAYYFAREVQAATGVPIGLLTSAVGGTNIELWISENKLLNDLSLVSYSSVMRSSLNDYEQQLAKMLPVARTWLDEAASAAKLGKPVPRPPAWPEFPFGEKMNRPRCVMLHNGMIAPLVPFALRGALWYQGEANADDALYLAKTEALLDEWRQLFRAPELPFYFVQLAAWQAPSDSPAGGGWGMIRDIQRQCLSIPRTGMASAIDIGDALDIHPKNKEDVGKRLALWALRNEYGQKTLVSSGPLFQSMKVEGNSIRIKFESLGGGLMSARKEGRKPAIETPGQPLKQFAIAGEDKNWFWADAVIDGDTVVVRSADVTAPVAVRYAYSMNPEGANLYNRNVLPASPFRTDDW